MEIETLVGGSLQANTKRPSKKTQLGMEQIAKGRINLNAFYCKILYLLAFHIVLMPDLYI